MEAFHYRYHPMAIRMVSLLRSGELGPIRHIEAWMCTPLLPAGDIRWQLGLAGGSTMDLGCYTIHLDAIALPRRARSRVGRGSGAVCRCRSMAARRHASIGWRNGSHHRRDAVAPGSWRSAHG